MGSIDLRGTSFEGLVLYSPPKQVSWWEDWWQFRYDRTEIYCGTKFKDLHGMVQDVLAGTVNIPFLRQGTGQWLAALWIQAEVMGVATEYEVIMDGQTL